MAEEVVLDAVQLFNENPYQIIVENSELVKLSPVNSIQNSSVLEFNLLPHHRFSSLSEIFIQTSVQILQDVEGESEKRYLTSEKQGYFANNLIANLFKNFTVNINGVQVATCPEYFPVLSFIETSLNYECTTAQYKLPGSGIFPPSHIDNLKNQARGSLITEFYNKINLLNTDKLIIPQCAINFKFQINDPEYYLIEEQTSGEGVTPVTYTKSKIKIHDIFLYIRTIKCRENYNLYLEQTLSSGANAIYEFKSSHLSYQSISKGSINVRIPALYSGPKPGIVLFSLIETKRLNGDRTQDPHKYSSNKLEKFSFLINEENYPTQPYEIKNTRTEKKYAKLFSDLHSALGIGFDVNSTMVEYSSYLDSQFFAAIDISSYSTALTNLREPSSLVSIGLDLKFAEATLEPLTVILYYTLPHRMEISASRTVSTIF